jgi:hypothetical protein
MAKLQAQVNIRLDAQILAVLEAAAFVHGLSVGELARQLLEAGAADLQDSSAVKKALQARMEGPGEVDDSRVTSISKRRSGGDGV